MSSKVPPKTPPVKPQLSFAGTDEHSDVRTKTTAYRSATTGRFVSSETAKRHPKATLVETRPRRRNKG